MSLATQPTSGQQCATDRVFFWDSWKTRATEAGMDEATAWAGRAMIRECYQHGWESYMGPMINALCGFDDDGAQMLAFGLSQPELAAKVWRYLEQDDAGNAPRSPRPSRDVRDVIMKAFSRGTWPA